MNQRKINIIQIDSTYEYEYSITQKENLQFQKNNDEKRKFRFNSINKVIVQIK